MNQRVHTQSRAEPAQPVRSLVAVEAPAIAGAITFLIFFAFGDTLFSDLHRHAFTVLMFAWLFGVMMWGSFGVMHHADAVAARLGEPYGTLVLTFAVIIIEVALFVAIMLHGKNNPTLARDAMFATLMIGINFMVGVALIMGALRYWEQECNLAGAHAFLVVIAALSVIALVLPNYIQTAPNPVEAPGRQSFSLPSRSYSTASSSSFRRCATRHFLTNPLTLAPRSSDRAGALK